MAALDPNEFDAFRAGEPSPVLKGKVSNLELDYFRASEPLLGLVVSSAALTATVTDAVSLSDVLTRTVAAARTLADALVLTDARAFARGTFVADMLALFDSVSSAKMIPKSLADTITLADLLSTAKGKAVNIDDTLALADLWSRALGYGRTQADGLILTDAMLDAQGLRLGDLVALSDLLVREVTTARSVDDAVALADQFSRVVAYARSTSDSVTLADAQSIVNSILTVLMDPIYTGHIGMGWTGEVSEIEQGGVRDNEHEGVV